MTGCTNDLDILVGGGMKFLISIQHPAWFHQYKHVIRELEKKGHEVLVLAINKDRSLELLEAEGMPYTLIGTGTGKNVLDKAWLFGAITARMFMIARKFRPDVFIGRASPMQALVAWAMGKPHLIFEDTERSRISLFFCKRCSEMILTPLNFNTDLGHKHKRIDVFKEMFYLHPERFTPDPEVIEELGVKEGERFFLLRFIAWNASHDIGHKGMSLEKKKELVQRLSQHGKVFISSEGPLPRDLEPYQLDLAPDKIHHVIYHASLMVSEGASMASEAVMLGTHTVYINPLSAGTTDEQESKYKLLYNYSEPKAIEEQALGKALELLQDPELEEKGRQKAKALFQGKVDPTSWFTRFFEEYPRSLKMLDEL